MVILKILTVLRLQSDAKSHSPILCLHIDYANRAESKLEASFLEDWVNNISNSVPIQDGIESVCRLKVRKIDEVTRGVTDREKYERVTREIRYQLYREALEIVGGGVILGHHQDDLRENVLSNVMRYVLQYLLYVWLYVFKLVVNHI